MLLSEKLVAGVKNRNKWQGAPELPATLVKSGLIVPVRLLQNEYPLLADMFDFPEPNLLTGAPSSDLPGQIRVRSMMPANLHAQMAKLGIQNQHREMPLHIEFFRMLAKIAHCFIVATWKESSFTPLLNPLILGEKHNYADYVGGTGHASVDATTLHKISSEPKSNGERGYLICRIQLFANLGMPEYQVVSATFPLEEAN